MARFIKFKPVTLKRDLDADETGSLPAGAVTVKVNGGAAITATRVGTTGAVYTAPLGVLALGVYQVAWFDGATQIAAEQVEIVGNHLCSVADVRAGDSEFADKAKFPAERIVDARSYVEDEFEQITGRSFVRRSVSVSAESDGSGFWLTGLTPSPTLLSVTVDGVAALLSDYAIDEAGILEGPALETAGKAVTVVVEYGAVSVPDDVRRVAGIRVRSVVAQRDTGLPDRATSVVSPEGGQISLATPGRAGYETGIPEVDAVLARYTNKIERDLWGML